MQLHLGVLHRSGKVGDELPLVQLFRAVEPVGLPEAELGFGHAAHLPGGRALHPTEEDVVRLLPVPVLRERQAGAGHVAVASLPPQTHQSVLLAEKPVQLGEGVEASRFLWVTHDVVLEESHGDVPRVVRLSEKLDELARNFGLRLRQRDTFQKRLDHVGANRGLPLVVLLGQQRDHRLGELHLLLASQRRPNDRVDEHPQVVRHVSVSSRHFPQGAHQVLDP